jgi:hypothetical protein
VLVRRHEPALTPCARFPAVEASVDENARKPDLERPSLAVRRDVRENLDEGVLDGLVRLGGVAQVLKAIRTARRWWMATRSVKRSRASSIAPASTRPRISIARRVSSE